MTLDYSERVNHNTMLESPLTLELTLELTKTLPVAYVDLSM